MQSEEEKEAVNDYTQDWTTKSEIGKEGVLWAS
jgi:hypothetical protein